MEDEIRKTQQLLGPYVTNPVLSSKLLQKPPLRFLHDIFMAVVNEHGMMRGLFDEDEVAWTDGIANDKDAKAFFIAKVINFISVASGTTLPARSARVCSGQEAENTNLLLQQLAALIANRNLPHDTILQRVRQAEGPESLKAFEKGPRFLTTTNVMIASAQSKPEKAEDIAAMSAGVGEKATEVKSSTRTGRTPLSVTPKPEKEKSSTLSRTVKVSLEKDSLPAKKGDLPVSRSRILAATNSSSPTDAIQRSSVASPETSGHADSDITLSSTRPTTARRAPQRPPTATAGQNNGGMIRRNTFVVQDDNKAPPNPAVSEPLETEAPPAGMRFLPDEDDQVTKDLLPAEDLYGNGASTGYTDRLAVEYGSSLGGPSGNNQSGQLVTRLRDTQKSLVESNGYKEDEASSNVVTLQETSRFKKSVDDFCTILQRVSRLTDILTSQMELLPEDLEDMDKDRLAYIEEIQLIQQRIEEANKTEEGEMDKLRRELSLQEEAVFVITEEISSTQYRIKEKTILYEKILRLTSTGRT